MNSHKNCNHRSNKFIEHLFDTSDHLNTSNECFKLKTCRNLEDILAYLNFLKTSKSAEFKEMHKDRNSKVLLIETKERAFDISNGNFKDYEEDIDDKIQILSLISKTREIQLRIQNNIKEGLSRVVNWEVFDRIIISFENLLGKVFYQLNKIYEKEVIRNNQVNLLTRIRLLLSQINILKSNLISKKFLKIYEQDNENLKDILCLIFQISENLIQITYFLIFHLDISSKNHSYLPMFNFLLEIRATLIKFSEQQQYVLARSLIKEESGFNNRAIEHFSTLIEFLKEAIEIEDFSLGNMLWVNFILELEVILLSDLSSLRS